MRRSLALFAALLFVAPSFGQNTFAEIRAVDAATARGVPLVELETVNSVKFVTDNAGRIAFGEPGLVGREVFFTIRSHGYKSPKDGFGIEGVRITPRLDKPAVITLTRKNLAERLCRLTGEGLHRDSVLLDHKPPFELNGKVAGQDSIQAAVYKNKVHWFWGDTSRMEYPLGLFRMAGATTDARALPELDLARGIPYSYFTDPKTGFARATMPLAERPQGVVWIHGVFVVPDDAGVPKLVGHYSRRKGLVGELEQGIAVWNDDAEIFEPAKQLPLTETWRRPSGHPIVHEESGTKWLLFGSPNPNVRVPYSLKDVLDPSRYEAFACTLEDGKPAWRWQKEAPPTSSKTEHAWIKEKKINAAEARFCPVSSSGEVIELHSGSVRWNQHRKKWVLVACQIGGKASFLGEVWVAESDQPMGPFRSAVQVLTHDKQTFYNVCHHAFLDRDGGRTIHFEGTYTSDFSGNPLKTPRYNYNQVLYRLDLDAVK